FVSNNAAVADVDGTLCCAAGDVESNDRVNETLQSAYVQLNMESIVAGRPLEIVTGLRYESAETESISYFPIPDILRWDMIAGLTGVNSGTGPIDAPAYGESSMILPSLSFAYSLDDDKVIRLSASKSMVRPDLVDLSSEFEIGNNDFFQPTAIAGNPQLQPLRSNNFDISYEDYYGDESYFAVNYFIKEISDFVGTRTTSGQQIEGLTDPTKSANAQFAMECVRDWVAAGRPDPGFPGDPGATGDCVSQQAIWAQGWMNDQQHMGWVALGMENGIDVSGGYPWAHGGLCGYDGWSRSDP
ncbi:MAG: TonB-dependent receptor, partial [Pseudomonadales bacterium]